MSGYAHGFREVRMTNANFASRACVDRCYVVPCSLIERIDAPPSIPTDELTAMSTAHSRLTVARPATAPTGAPAGQSDATPTPLASGGATARALTGPMIGLRGMGTPSKKGGSASFGARKTAPDGPKSTGGSVEALTAEPAIPTGYALPPGVGRPSAPNPGQMPQFQNRPPQMPIPPNRPMRPPMLNDGQSPLHHLWTSLTKIGENMASLIQAIARAMGNLHH